MNRLIRPASATLAVLATTAALGATALGPGTAEASTGGSPAIAEPSADAVRYKIGAVVRGGSFGTVSAFAMNEHGEVAGAASYPLEAFRWSASEGFQGLPGLEGHEEHVARGISDDGTVVGVAGQWGEARYPRAARWVDGVPEDLGVLEPGGSSEAFAVNDAGMVVGTASAGFLSHAFVWTEDDGMVDITGSWGTAYAVNEAGQVVGDRGSRPFLWQDGVISQLEPAPGYPFGFAYAINEIGQVAGSVKVSGGLSTERLARWSADGEVEILGGAGDHNRMYGINDDGTAVGVGVIGSGYDRGVIYHDELGLRYIDDLLTTDEVRIFSGRAIDDSGRILAAGLTSSGAGITTILVPVSGPFMHEARLTVRDRGARSVATLRVVAEDGTRVHRADVVGAWYDGDQLVQHGVGDRTDRRGRAKIVTGVGLDDPRFCVVEISHAAYDYVPADGGPPPCSSPAAG